jgi:carboxylesterase type B
MSLRTVQVEQGIVRGCEELLPDGRKYLRFSGIPYAKIPERFQRSQKLLKFDKPEIDCTRERDPCFHKSTLTKQFVGSEDCLNLNVYVPEKLENGAKKFAVIVFIHGGGFKYDSNTKDL